MTPEEQSFWERAAMAALTGLCVADGERKRDADELAADSALCADALLDEYRKRRQ